MCLLALVYTQTVYKKNQCNECGQFKSQQDCSNEIITDQCEWVEASGTTPAKCQKRTTTPEETFKAYCQLVEKPEANCASTFGCAYLNSSCTNFAGCSAYVKTTTAECQAISYFCVSDGVSCIEAKECKDYTITQCESTPSISGIKKCKWNSDAGVCRDYACFEADATLTTDDQCRAWLGGCVTRLKGCWTSPLPLCSVYDLDANQCAYRGFDGLCEPDTASTKCKVKDCANAPVSITTDDECKAYQDGCISNGKGCIKATSKPLCSSYSGDNTTCVGYIGSDGVCEGDAAGTKCRARKCENGLFTTDDLCRNYQASCVTNGKQCTAAKGTCSSFKGTATSCAVYIGTDGYCKGTSTTTEAACAPKVCDEAPATNTTNDACNKFQIDCVTNGAGCSTRANLRSCATYDGDATSCLSKVGSEGNCTWKTGTKCIARTCDGASTTLNSNTTCGNYFKNCVTTGAGCVSSTTCDLTVKQPSCEGTTDCGWQPICTSNSACSQFTKKSICLANQARVFVSTDDDGVSTYRSQKCAWLGSSCKNLECSDLTGTAYNNHTSCLNELSTCMSNLVDTCITKYECTRLKGSKATCLGYPGYCTNTDAAVDDTLCKLRVCTDNTDANDNQTCDAFLPGCISNGNGCVDYTTTCATMVGNQATCNNIYAYQSGTATSFTTNQCYNTSDAADTANCFVKQCSSARGMTNDGGCASFLTGTSCEYDGNGSCVDPSTATCGSYTGDATFCENAKVGENETKYCFGTSTSATCQLRVCSQNTTATNDTECDTFLSGCIAKYEGGCETRSARACTAQKGSTTSCSTFSGGISSSEKVQCARYDSCDTRACADKTTPTAASDCTNYKSTCRFLKSGAACIDHNTCANYNTPDTATTDAAKLSYCSTIEDLNGNLCGFTSGSTCAVRTCDQVNNSAWTSKPACTTYTTDCKLAGNICYLPVAVCNYTKFEQTSPSDAEKLTQCKLYTNSNNVNCTQITGGATCVEQNTCETVITQTDAKTCNDFLKDGKCQKVTNTGCLTTATACTTYTLTSTLTALQKTTACQALKIVDTLVNMGAGTAIYTACTYSTGNACSAIAACSDIAGPTSQADCKAKQPTGKVCFFYNNACKEKVAVGGCASADLSALTTDSAKSLFCNSLTEDNTVFCTLNPGKTACAVSTNTDCAFGLPIPVSPALPGWDGDSAAATYVPAYCATKTDNKRTVQCKANPGNNGCLAATCEDITGATSQAACDNHIYGCIYYNNRCRTSILGAAGDCAIVAQVPFASDIIGLSVTERLAYCQKFKKIGTVLCTFDAYKSTPDAFCMDAPAACLGFTSLPSSGQLAYCLSQIIADGSKCAFKTGTSTCVAFDCNYIVNPTSQVDCDQAAGTLHCKYYKGTCYNTVTGCAAVVVPSSLTSSEKKNYCDKIQDANSEKCTYISGDNCVKRGVSCNAFDVTSIDANSRLTTCNSLKDVSENKCSYISGTSCAIVGVCTSYTGATLAYQGPESTSESVQCPLIKSNVGDGYPCKGDVSASKRCVAQTCEDNDSSATNCSNNAPGCVYFNSKCYTKTICASYTPEGADNAAKQLWCEGITDSSGNKCAWDSVNTQCKNRSCSDKSYYTNEDCQGYLSSCKTNGTQCISYADLCNTLKGSQSFCETMLDSTGENKCKITSSPSSNTSSEFCWNRTCYDNVTATSDSECDQFMTNCVTRGTGCIPRDQPCSAYRGTKTTCETFKQYTGLDDNDQPLYTLCSGDATNTETSPCRVRVCGDNTTATDDTTCTSYMSGCVTKGTGCIEATSACTSYRGDQTTCAKFKGSSGAEYCWNTAAALATSACARKRCSDISGTNNDSCNNGMKPTPTTDIPKPPPLCVFDGTGCVDNTKTCSQFSGTEEACPIYIATDGPCKSTTVGTIKGACARKVCTEAPNSLATDAECQAYHPTCYTTGYGCTAIKQCRNLTNSASCKSRPECAWTNQCYTSATSCSTYSNTSYSACVNSKQKDGTQCAWVELTSKCQAQTCEDQPASYTTHEKCKAFSDSCTTTGAGCITRTTCDRYRNPAICTNASVNADGTGRCGWDKTNKCRARACSDTDGTTNEVCDKFLTGCVTNGTSCVAGNSCSDFISAKYCLSSKTGPCLWVNGTCYNYDRCEDALMRTHSGCQAFSGMCTTNGTNCVPITSCALTGTKAACVIGTDGACGWLPTGTCQKFGACSDAVSAVQDDCQSYGPSCVTNGTTCVTVGKCSDYKTLTACGNAGTDGICYWNATSTTCKLKECTDVQSTTNDACKVITVSGGVTCTTNGTNCIPLSACSSYVEAGCFTGTDGDCAFALPVGATTGTKACRPKQCEDIADGKNNSSCSGVIKGRECVSNGATCIAKAACSSYKVATACNGGGIEGTNSVVCAFTPKSDTDKVNGTCKTFSACADANKDQAACKSNSSCFWSQSGTTTSCVTHTCSTFASGADCQPIPSFDGSSFTVCVLQNGTCQAADPGTMTDVNKCYTKSAYTYSWNQATNKCEGCSASSTPNNTTNGTTNGTNGTDTTTDFGSIISIISLGLLGFMA